MRAGDTLGVFAPGSPVNHGRLERGAAELMSRGFKLELPLDPSRFYGDYSHGFGSASCADRANALMTVIRDERCAALLAARGGYGTQEILPLIDFAELARSRKLLIGYSDVTALLAAAVGQGGIISIHGPTLSAEFAESATIEYARQSADLLVQMLTDPAFRIREQVEVIRAGAASSGPIIAGNLSILTSLIGTPWDLSYSGAILVIEEVGEAPYRVHRALLHLKYAGKLDQLAGIVFGRFSKCTAGQGPTIDDVYLMAAKDIFARTSFPIVRNLDFGHNGRNVPLPLGCLARIDGTVFELIESPIEV